jgi:four helix bundle protein
MEESVTDHPRLETFGLADELALAVYSTTSSFPPHHTSELVTRMRNSAVSVATEIVARAGTRSESDDRRFVDSAFASIRELSYLIGLAHRLGYLTAEQTRSLRALQGRTAWALVSLMRSADQ